MSESQKIVGRISTRQTTPAHGDVGLREEAANPTYGGMASSGFRECTLDDIAEFRNGKALSADMYLPFGQHPVFGSNGQIARTNEVLTKEPLVVIGRVGAYCGSVHHVDEPAWVTDNAIIATGKDQIDVRFLFYLLGSLELRRTAIGSAQPLMTQGGLKVVPAIAPPLPEQKTIAHILGTLDDKIELSRRMNATLEAMVRALFQNWFVDFDPVRAKLDGRKPAGLDAATAALFPAHFQDSSLGHIPQGWTIGKIQDCCTQIQNGGTPRRDEPRYWDGGNIPWLASGEVRQSIITATESFITEAGLKESSAKWVPAYSTVIALYGATAGQVSFVSSPLTTNQAVCALIPKKRFEFFNYLTMLNATTELEGKAVGSAQQNISKGIVEETQVILPPSPVVEQFTTSVDPFFGRWIANLHQSRTLSTLRDALLPKLLSGKLRVPGNLSTSHQPHH